MPIPVHTDHFLAQAVFKPDNLPDSNSFVNTFFFRNDGIGVDADEMADTVKDVLDSFYAVVHSPATATIASILSIVIDTSVSEYRVYDLGEAAPRTPHVRSLGWSGTGGGGLPNELSACISYYASSNVKRRRGRIFMGPLSSATTTLPTGDQDVRVHPTTIGILAAGAADLANTTEDVTWEVYSRMDDDFFPITAGWVDNAFDIQRRRGAVSSVRTTWT